MTNYLSVAGLAWDKVGVVFLALALIKPIVPPLGGIGTGKGLAGPLGGPNAAYIAYKQQIDAYFGLPLLVFGFAIQMVASLGQDVSISWLLVLIGLLAVIILGYLIGAKKFLRWQVRKKLGILDF
jgi:predicted permease